MRELTLRQEPFCEAFILHDGNISRAYAAAGYSTKSGGVHNFPKLLALPQIRARIEAIRAEITRQHVDLRERLIAQLSDIAFFNVADHLSHDGRTVTVHDLGDLTRSQAS